MLPRSLEDPDPSSDDLRKTVADMFSPAVLHTDGLMKVPVAHGQLQNFLESRGVTLEQHKILRIVLAFAYNVYDDQENKQAGMKCPEIVTTFRRNLRKKNPNLGPFSTPLSGLSEHSGMAHSIAMRLTKDTNFFELLTSVGCSFLMNMNRLHETMVQLLFRG